MKRFFIFLMSLLITGAAFADGYGKVKWWKIYSRNEILALNRIENLTALPKNESDDDEDIDEADYLILWKYTHKFKKATSINICFEKYENNYNYIPRSVMYFIPNTEDKEVNAHFEKYEVLRRITENLQIPDSKMSNFEKIAEFTRLAIAYSYHTHFKTEISKEQNKPTVTVYRYNEDTIAIVYQNCIEGQTLVVYTYHEPDY